MLPLLAGDIPFGLLYGALAPAAGVPASITMAMSTLVFAGSAQFIAIQLIGGGAPALVVFLTALVVNLRHSLYGISISPFLKHLPSKAKGFLAYFLTDEAYAVSIVRFRQEDLRGQAAGGPRHWFYLGAGATLWLGWQLSTAAGIAFGSQAPASWHLDFAIPLTFIALLVPVIKNRVEILAAITAGAVAILLANIPLKLGLVAAMLSGILVGSLAEILLSHRKAGPAGLGEKGETEP